MSLKDDVKQRLGVVEVVSEYVALTRPDSRTPTANCPFHEESTPSFKLHPDRQVWRCYGCNEGGDIFAFVQKIEGIGFGEALDKLCDWAGIERRRDRDDDHATRNAKPPKSEIDAIHGLNLAASDYWHKQLGTPAGAAARQYLEGRGIDLETARRWKIGYAPGGPNSLMHYLKSVRVSSSVAKRAGVVVKTGDGMWRDMFLDRIIFAIQDRHGNVVGFAGRAMDDSPAKYINTQETQSFRKSELLYGMHAAGDAIHETGRAVIVEGYLDVIAAHTHGFRNVVASMGTAVTRDQLRSATAALPFGGRRELVFALDNDAAGQQAAMDSLRVALEALRTRNGSTKAFEIKVAGAAASTNDAGAPAPKDPDEAIRQDAAAWAQSIEAAHEAYRFVVEAALSSGGDALAAVEPFLANPATDTARIKWLSGRLGVEYSGLLASLSQLSAARMRSQQDARRGRGRGYGGNANGAGRGRDRGTSGAPSAPAHLNGLPARPVDTSSRPTSDYEAGEYELAACLMQHASALDYAESLEPSHFTSPRLGRLFELRKTCSSPDDLEPMLADDAGMLALYHRLRVHVIEFGSLGVGDDESQLMHIVNACARRTIELSKRSRIRVLGDELQRHSANPDIVRKLLEESVRTSHELSTLLAQAAT